MAFTIDYETEINAPLDTVWEVITDVKRYREWNRFTVECESTLKPGDFIDMKVDLFGKPQPQREVIFTHVPKQSLSYGLDGGSIKAILSNREHTVKALGADRTLYRSHFELSGWMMPVVRMLMKSRLKKGFGLMTEGIKQQAEKLHRQRR